MEKQKKASRRFRMDATYMFGIPNVQVSNSRTAPTFVQNTTISMTGRQLKEQGITTIDDLSKIALNPPLKINRTYWVYEVKTDLEEVGQLSYVGEMTVLSQYRTVQPGNQYPTPRYNGIPLDQQPVGMTTLGDAMSEQPISNYNEWKAKFEAAEDTISTLQDSIAELRSDREEEIQRHTQTLTEAASQQRSIIEAQLAQANQQIDRLQKQISEKDREIFRLQQDKLDLQGRHQALKMKTEFQRDWDRNQRALEKQQQQSSGLGDIAGLMSAIANFAPLLPADRGAMPKPSSSGLSDNQGQNPVRPQPKQQNNHPAETNGSIAQPIAERDRGVFVPPPPLAMAPPQRKVIPIETDAQIIGDNYPMNNESEDHNADG